mgnify:CR=1 FL=1
MKVKKFVGELDELNANWIEGNYIPQIVDKEGNTYRISSVDFSKNSVVYLIAATSQGLDAKEFDKLTNGTFGEYNNVKYFGITGKTKNEVGEQVEVLY